MKDDAPPVDVAKASAYRSRGAPVNEVARLQQTTPSRPPGRRISLVRAAVIFYGALLAVSWIGSALAGDSLLYASASAARRGVRPLADAGLGLVAGALVILLSDQLTRRTRAGDALARALARELGRLDPVRCALLAAVSGVAEEAFFRGILQPWIGLVAASLVFGAAHFVPRRDLMVWSVFAVAAGFLLGSLFEATGNLVAPVVAHASINAVNLHLLSTRYAGAGNDA
jgi:membrane protease YdiL (CAAX protease family)